MVVGLQLYFYFRSQLVDICRDQVRHRLPDLLRLWLWQVVKGKGEVNRCPQKSNQDPHISRNANQLLLGNAYQHQAVVSVHRRESRDLVTIDGVARVPVEPLVVEIVTATRSLTN